MKDDFRPNSPAQSGVERIAIERDRQIYEEGHTEEGDVGRANELAKAGLAYAEFAAAQVKGYVIDNPTANWPWDNEAWKPDLEEPVPNLVKAGALIAAAIDALGSDL